MNDNLLTVKAMIAAFCTALGAFLGWKGVMLVAWAAVMLLDYISGTIAAAAAGEWCSQTAREGIRHKGGMILVVMVAAIADVVMVVIVEYIPIGLQWPGLILPMVLAWYIITELGSILENAVKLGAPVPQWLVKLLLVSAKIVEAAGDAALADRPETAAEERV